MENDIKTMAIEKLNELIVKGIPEENRDEEELDYIKKFGKNCFIMGYELGFLSAKKGLKTAVI